MRRVSEAERYRRKLARETERQRRIAAAGRDIGPIPPVADNELRQKCDASLAQFCMSCLCSTFYMPWSDDHLSVISALERVIFSGGRYVVAMPRGSGKTSLLLAGCLWALLTGRRKYVVVLAATGHMSQSAISTIRTWLEQDTMLQLYPEVSYPIRRAEGLIARIRGQTCCGKRTSMEWTASRIRLPWIDDSRAAGAIVAAYGMTGAIRGAQAALPDGKIVRPDLVLIDDPQDDEVARSPTQVQHRINLIDRAVLGLGGPNVHLAALAAVTVICRNDLADILLSRPDWQCARYKLLYEFPTRMDLWDEYRGLLEQDEREASEFYLRNREDMDAGARVAWPSRYTPNEHSAVQHAMNVYIKNENAFWAEYQNEPREEEQVAGLLSTADLASHLTRLPQGVVPIGTVGVTGFIDVQQHVLYYMLVAWRSDTGGDIIEYGTYPQQPVSYFSSRNLPIKLIDKHPGMKLDDAVASGLSELLTSLLTRSLIGENGTLYKLQHVMVDAGWGAMTERIQRVCRTHPMSALITPSFARGFHSRSENVLGRARPGDRTGHGWRETRSTASQSRYIIYDADFWKCRIYMALQAPADASGAILIYGARADIHRLLFDHLTSEYPRGESPVRWYLKPNRDNHWWDCLVGSAVAAASCGVNQEEPRKRPERRKLRASELYKAKWNK